MDRAIVHFDGASVLARGRYIGGWGFTVEAPSIHREEFGHLDLAESGATNNVAEYTAAVRSLEYLVQAGYHGPVEVYGDSQLVVRQFTGEYRVRAEHLRPYHERLQALGRSFESVRFVWIPREENQRADTLSKQGLSGEG